MAQIFQGKCIPDLYDHAHVAGWEPYSPHDVEHASWVGSVPYTVDPAQHILTADSDVDDLSRLSI